MDERTFTVPPEASDTRLDQFLTEAVTELSRSQVGRAVSEGRVTVDAAKARKAGQKLAAGQRVALVIPPPAPDRALPEDLPLDVRYEDSDLVVVAKPAGLVVHPAHGHAGGTLVNALLHHCDDLSGVGGVLRPGVVHRLDRDTSGLLVVAKNDKSHRALAAQFKAHSVERRYMALVLAGARLPEEGEFRTLYGRHPTDRLRFSSRVARGRVAITSWRTLETIEGLRWLDVALATGRTHQIRVHFADHGAPILGDPLYGRGGKLPREVAVRLAPLRRTSTSGEGARERQALHAYALGFAHPRDGRPLRFFEPPPPDLFALLLALFGLETVETVLRSLDVTRADW